MVMTDSDKHFSLLRYETKYGRKKFYSVCPRIYDIYLQSFTEKNSKLATYPGTIVINPFTAVIYEMG